MQIIFMDGPCQNAYQQEDLKGWAKKKKVQDINLATHTNDIKKGLILDVDLEHPSSLHKLHNDYPLAAEKI